MNSSPSQPCARCGTPLPSATAACPVCLMGEAMKPTGEDANVPPPLLSAEELAPHFPQLEILECLGRGGMGVVYRARQKSLNRLVALKLLAPERVADAQFAARFMHEAQALAALSHPHIVTIHDFGQTGGFYFLLMEFVDGVNLRQAMKAGRFTPEQALAIVPPVCEALQYAHEHGIVHRDIKPENLLLDKEGRVKIADFGIAKMLGAESSLGLAESQPAGTPQYMAPEQKAQRATDHRADIYSLGVVLYEMLTGELPAGKLQPPSSRVQVDVRIDEIVLRALEKAPELRYQTAVEFRTQVETAAADKRKLESIAPATERDPFHANHKLPLRLRLILGAVFIVCLVNFAGPHITRLGNQPERTFTIGLSTPWLVAHPQYVDATRYVRALKFNFRSSSFRSGLVALVIATTLIVSRRNVRLKFRRLAGIRNATEAPTAVREKAPGPPHLSRLAVSGACWVPVTPVALATVSVAMRMQPDGVGPRWWQLAVLMPLLLIAVAGPFGTTILGWLAVGEIRRSQGKVRGLQLAVFDGLVYPVMALGAVISVSGVALAKMVVDFYANPAGIGQSHLPLVTRMANWLSQNKEAAVVVGVLAAVVVNALIVRGVMRAARREAAASHANSATEIQTQLASLAVLFALMSTAFGAFAALRSAGAWPAMAAAFFFAAVAIFMALPARRAAAGVSAIVIGGLGMVIWPLVALVAERARPVPLAETSGPEIESVTVAEAHVVVKARGSNYAGMIFLFGNEADRWMPGGLVLESMFDVSLTSGGFTRGVRWNVKLRHGRHARYRLEGPVGSKLGKIVLNPGTPLPEADGAYVIGGFRPDDGPPLPIAVKVERSAEAKPPDGVPDDADLQRLSWHEFDQTQGRYWRALSDAGRFAEAGDLIERYLALHPELEQGPAALNGANLHFHAAQCRASHGDYERALKQIQAARHQQPTPGGLLWNEYVDGTAAFLRGDKTALDAARDKLAAGHDINKPNVAALDRLLANFGKPYAEAYRGGDSRESKQ